MATLSTQSIGLQMHDITQCSICLETFKDPRVLPCIHTFCLKCLQSLCENVNPGQEASCPLCRKVFTVPPGGVKDIQNNFFMNQLVQVNQSANSAGECIANQPQFCELCLESAIEVSAEFFCIECDQCICDKCYTVHKKLKVSKSHKVLDVHDNFILEHRKKVGANYCAEHPDKQVDLFCFDCSALTCIACYVGNHYKHDCADITKAAEKFNEQLTEDINRVSTCILQNNDCVKEIETNKEKFMKKVHATEVEISNLIKDLNCFKIQALKNLECKKEEIECQTIIMESFTRYCQELKDKGSACDISRTATDIHVRAEELVTEVEQYDSKLGEVFTQFRSSFSKKACEDNFIGELFPCGPGSDAGITLYSESRSGQESLHNSSSELAESIQWDATSFLDQPKLLHTISGTVGSIFGITTLGNELFVVQGQTWRGVDVYDSESFTFKRFLPIPESKKLELILGCFGCLYMTFNGEAELLRYEYSQDTYTDLVLDGICSGLSKTSSNNILVTLYDIHKLEERDPVNWNLIKTIKLDTNVVPRHGIKLSDSYFLLIHLEECKKGDRPKSTLQKNIYIVDSIRRISKSCRKTANFQLCHMVMDNKCNVLVTNSIESKIPLLDQSLNLIGHIEIPDYKNSYYSNIPLVLHLDEINRRLYIGELKAGGRIFVLQPGVHQADDKNHTDEDDQDDKNDDTEN